MKTDSEKAREIAADLEAIYQRIDALRPHPGWPEQLARIRETQKWLRQTADTWEAWGDFRPSAQALYGDT